MTGFSVTKRNSESWRMIWVSSFPVPLGSIPELPAESCREIKASEGGQAVSGKYWFDDKETGKSVLNHCDMDTEGNFLKYTLRYVFSFKLKWLNPSWILSFVFQIGRGGRSLPISKGKVLWTGLTPLGFNPYISHERESSWTELITIYIIFFSLYKKAHLLKIYYTWERRKSNLKLINMVDR